jgi:hypothetical protein
MIPEDWRALDEPLRSGPAPMSYGAGPILSSCVNLACLISCAGSRGIPRGGRERHGLQVRVLTGRPASMSGCIW